MAVFRLDSFGCPSFASPGHFSRTAWRPGSTVCRKAPRNSVSPGKVAAHDSNRFFQPVSNFDSLSDQNIESISSVI
ncbi:hypothetical protein RSSM_06498 [Rhodopirellula sallentina SM41]|uniref:Uncharacterized protein n=1 Tax=Rhodopirellula sallentina SM41 TaxID=1263870 RepID=M5U7X3_9BACT|nr:hypothetical protein RSSM_06498 [Rhodopirellula sallentina SM41]